MSKEYRFRNEQVNKIGVGIIASAGNNYMIINTDCKYIDLLDLKTMRLTSKTMPTPVENLDWITKQEFEAMTEPFQYTLSDWTFKEAKISYE